MRREKKWRYYCDFCKKSKGTSSSMKIHEKHCTMNPKRDCRMCERISGGEDTNKDMEILLSVIPDIEKHSTFTDHGTFQTRSVHKTWLPAIKTAIDKLRDLTLDCPMCMFAALRQSGALGFIGHDEFDYEEEVKDAFQRANEEQYRL